MNQVFWKRRNLKKNYEEEKGSSHLNLFILFLSLCFFFFFDGCNSFSRDVLVYFLRA